VSVTCPQGHTSEATDYCDVCGARIGAAPASAPAPPTAEAAAAAPATGTKVCPTCGAANDNGHRYCEGCGYDFVDGVMPTLTLPPPVSPAAPAPAAPAAPPAPAPPAASGWEVVVLADRAYYDRNQAESIPFPVACPERHFGLGGTRAVIGRRSVSRGITPEIDLSGAPEDAAISHVHAVLVNDPATGWTVVDPGSSNGTFVNDGADPIPVNTPVALKDGDEIHIGAWTTLRLHQTGGSA
jgi:hypothetical protein